MDMPHTDARADNLVEIRDLSVAFETGRGPVQALRHVDLDVPRGRILGIVGESGSGKSTVIWAMMRLLAENGTVTGGAIRFGGRDLLKLDADALRAFRGAQAGVVFQDPMTSQIPVKSYLQQFLDIAYRSPGSRAEKAAHAVAMMRRVGIPDPEQRVTQFPHQFSGGMRQRAGIAMALLMHPDLLIADEPTTALDVTMEAQVIHLLKELQREFQTTMMIVSHNLGLVAELCDEIVVMYAGEVVERGDIHAVFARPSHPYTRALIECDPARVLARTRFLPTIPGELPNLRRPPAACVFVDRCPHAFDRCHAEKPRPYRVDDGRADEGRAGDGHVAACHLLDRAAPAIAGASPAPVIAGASPAPVIASASPARAPAEEPPVAVAGAAPLVEVRNLDVSYRVRGPLAALLKPGIRTSIDILVDVSLDLKPGETLGLVGESGSGKTTLGRAILGLVRAQAGSVKFRGRELTGLGEGALRPLRQNMAMMFQDPIGSLSPRQNVKALILEPFDVHRPAMVKGRAGDRNALAERLADMVNLPRDLLLRYPHQLSGGQARRVGVARALALEPDLIVADEPTAGLDVSVQGDVLNLMRRLQIEHGLTYLIISHNLPVVRHISDRLAIMYLGRIIEMGEAAAIFARPAHPYTRALVDGIPRPDPTQRRRLVSIEGEVPSVARRPQGCEFNARCPFATDLCRAEMPQERQLADGRGVRCHYPLID